MKKILSVLLFSMLVIAMGVTAFAVSENCVITVDGVEYTDFATGWSAGLKASANNENVVEIVLHADWKADANGSFGSGHGFANGAIYITGNTKDMCLDLNGHTIDRGLFSWDDISTAPDTSKKRKSGEVINIEDGCDRITIKNGTIRGGSNDGHPGGGGIFCEDSNVVFENVTFRSNYSSYGGGLTLFESKGEFKNCVFELNHVSVYGGAICAMDSSAILRNCSVKNNKSNSSGGGIHVNAWSDNLGVYDCEFAGNQALSGGAVYTVGKAIIENTDFNHNTTTSYGGAIYASTSDPVEIKNCTFFGNNSREGGTIWAYAPIKIRSCEFENNVSTVDGCCRFNDDTLIEGCTFKNNIGNGDSPSVIFVAARGEVTIRDTEITGNTGKCAVSVSTGNGRNLGELWIDGTVVIDDNFDSRKREVNVMLGETGLLSASISMKKNFSRNSRIGLAMDADDMENEKAITDIPDGWTKEELSEVFSFNPVYGNGTANTYYYLCKSGSNIIFKKGVPENDENAIYNKEERQEAVLLPDVEMEGIPESPGGTMVEPEEENSAAGSVIGEGSAVIIAVFAVIAAAAGAAIVIRNKKR